MRWAPAVQGGETAFVRNATQIPSTGGAVKESVTNALVLAKNVFEFAISFPFFSKCGGTSG